VAGRARPGQTGRVADLVDRVLRLRAEPLDGRADPQAAFVEVVLR
jgi:hypothetical protein